MANGPTELERQRALAAAVQGEPIGPAQFPEQPQQPPLEAQAVSDATRAVEPEEMFTGTARQAATPTGEDSFLAPSIRLGGFLDKLFPSDQPAADLTRADIFPTFDQPIRVGAVQGRVIGTQPIFVAPAPLFPFNILEKRKKALEDAAKAKAAGKKAAKDKFLESIKAEKTAEQFQQEWLGDWQKGINDFRLKHNDDFAAVDGDVDWHIWRNNMIIRGNLGTQLDARATELLKSLDDAKIYVPPEGIVEAREIKSGDIDLLKEDLGEKILKMEQSTSISGLLETGYASLLEQKVTSALQKVPNLLENKGITIANVKKTLLEDIDQSAQDVFDSDRTRWEILGQGVNDIKRHLTNMFPAKIEQSFDLFRTESFRVGRTVKPPEIIEAEINEPVNVVNKETGKTEQTAKAKSWTFAGKDFQPKNINITATRAIDPTTGEELEPPVGSFEVDINEALVSYVNPENGRIVTTNVGNTQQIVDRASEFDREDLVEIVVRGEGVKIGDKTLPKGSTLWIPAEDVDANLRRNGIEFNQGQVRIKTPEEEGDITVIGAFQ